MPTPAELRTLREKAADCQKALTDKEITRHVRRVQLTKDLTGSLTEAGRPLSATAAQDAASVHPEITALNYELAQLAHDLARAEAAAEECRLLLDTKPTPPTA